MQIEWYFRENVFVPIPDFKVEDLFDEKSKQNLKQNKTAKSKHSKNLPFEHLNIRSETNLNQFRKSFKIPLTFSSPVKLKLIPPSQTSNLVSQITEFS